MELIEIKMKKKAIIISIKGLKLTNKEKRLFKENPWGLILFQRNIESIKQIQSLIEFLKQIR